MKSYHLQKMGIDLWVRRSLNEPAPLLHVLASPHTQTSLMIVLEGVELDAVNHWPAGKAGGLLTNMLRSIGLTLDNTAVLCGVTVKTEQEIQLRDALLVEQVQRLKPKLLLILGQFLTQSNPHIPVLLSSHPMDLLTHPMKKKKAFADLMKVRQLLD